MKTLMPVRQLQPSLAPVIGPRALERVMRAKGDVRLGVPVILSHQGAAVVMVAVEALSDARFTALTADSAHAQVVVTQNRASALDVTPHGPASAVVALPLPADVGLDWVMAMADPAGLHRKPSSVPDRMAGSILHMAAIALAKSAQVLPAALVVPVSDPHAFGRANDLCVIDASEVLAQLSAERVQMPVSQAALPMAVHLAGRVHVFRPDDGSIEHYAVEIGAPDLSQPVLVRLHSACFTGDVLGSLKCDCGAQLQATCETMARTGGGVLLYLNQEGRGIGMANKMRAYALQDQGLDTVEANTHLGFDDDERDFRNASGILAQLGITRVRLLTNNPAKIATLQAHGITVTERVPLRVGQTPQNARYLATKAAKSGHMLT